MSVSDPSGRGTSAWVTAIRQRHMPTTPKLLLMVLADYVNGDDECWPGAVALAPEVGVTPRTIQIVLRDLEAKGVIKREHRVPLSGRGRAVDTIRLVYDGLASAFAVIERPNKPAPGRPATNAKKSHLDPHDQPEVDARPTGSSRHDQPEVDDIPSSFMNQSVEPPNEPSPRESPFDAFWQAYPQKTAKGAARRAWGRALRAVGGEHQRIVDGAKRYRDDPNRDPGFTAAPATWLNGDRWDDDPLPPRFRGRAAANRDALSGDMTAAAAFEEYKRRRAARQ